MRRPHFDDCLGMAKAYLATKQRTKHYTYIYAVQSEIDDSYQTYCKKFVLSDEEVEKIRALKQQHGDDFVDYIDEVFGEGVDKYDYEFFGFRECNFLVDISTDPFYKYCFGIHEVDGDKVSHFHEYISLRDDDYVKLIAWNMCKERLTFNNLYHYDKELWDSIMRSLDYECYNDEDFEYKYSRPFLITMDEAAEDAEKLVKRYNEIIEQRIRQKEEA